METKNIYQKLLEVKKVGIKLQRDTDGYGYKYATLSQIQEKLNTELEKQALLVIHSVEDNKVVTRVIDTDSEKYVISEILMADEGAKPQDKGSEITYYRRYNLLSLLDLEVEDDDGKKAQESVGKIKEKKTWYNDTEKHISKWEDMVAEGKTTGKEILAKVTANGVCINGKDKETILNLDK